MKTNKIVAMFQEMLEMQDQMNTKVHPEWATQGFEWYDAIWTECGEMLDHYGWKWWKNQEPDIEQVKLELVDIFHFGMSSLMADKEGKHSALVELMLTNEYSKSTNFEASDKEAKFKDSLRKLAAVACIQKSFDMTSFFELCNIVGLELSELYTTYVAKNVLNFFRQDNGYKDGSYIKMWNGEEDNVVLYRILETLDPTSETFKTDLYKALEENYQLIKAGK